MSQTPTNSLTSRTGPRPASTGNAQPQAKHSGPLAILEARRDTIGGLLAAEKPEQLERFIRSAAFAIARDPKGNLARCTQNSIIESVCAAAELKLDFTPSLGLAYLVPYGVNIGTKQAPKWEERAQLQIGYRGLVTLALRAGAVRAIEAHAVHENDTFEHEMGTDPRIVHRRPRLGEQRGRIVGAYAIATMPDGTKQADVMDIDEVEAIRSRSKSGDFGPWKSDFSEMAKKTVTKRLCKYLKLTPEIGKALEVDNEDTNLDPVDEQPRPSNTSRLSAAVGIEPPAPAEVPEITTDDHASPGHPAHTPHEFPDIEAADLPF